MSYFERHGITASDAVAAMAVATATQNRANEAYADALIRPGWLDPNGQVYLDRPAKPVNTNGTVNREWLTRMGYAAEMRKTRRRS